MTRRTFVVVNPASAGGATGRRWPELRAALDRVLPRWDHAFTLGPGGAVELARKAALDGYEMVVAVGGDGTNNEVVRGLVDAERRAPVKEGLILGVVRRGTGGDFARLLALPDALPDAVAHLGGDHTQPIDVGLATLAGPDGAPVTRAFLNIVSFGLSGLVVETVNRGTKSLGSASFLVGTLRAMARYRRQDVQVSIDGAPFYAGPVVTCAIANGQYFGGGMRIARDARLDDGLLDVVLLTESGPREVLRTRDMYTGAVADWPSVRRGRGRQIQASVLSTGPLLVDLDGEQPGRLPLEALVLPGALRLKIAG